MTTAIPYRRPQRFSVQLLTSAQLVWGVLLIYLLSNLISYSFRNDAELPRLLIGYPGVLLLNLFLLFTLLRYHLVSSRGKSLLFFCFSILSILHLFIQLRPDLVVVRNLLLSGWGWVSLSCCALFVLAPNFDNLSRFVQIYAKRMLLPGTALLAVVFFRSAVIHSNSITFYNSCDLIAVLQLGLPLIMAKAGTIRRLLVTLSVLLWVGLGFITDERHMIASAGSVVISYLLVYWRSLVKESKYLVINGVALLLLIGGAFVTISQQDQSNFQDHFSERYTDFFINEGVVADTRSFAFGEVWDEMSFSEILIGRGILGTYEAPLLALEGEEIRYSVEIGVLWLLLKVGIFGIVLFFGLFLQAVYLGLFRSRNRLCHYLALLILFRLLGMLLAFTPKLDVQYFLLWMMAGMLFSREFRFLSDKQINAT